MKFSINSFIYKHLIDRILSSVQRSVVVALKPSDRVLDVACGTGSLSISMSLHAAQVLGIDLSEDMIGIARVEAQKRKISNVNFEIHDASDLSQFGDNEFDVAVTSMAIHQFTPALAVQILKEMKRISSKVIVMDYFYPIPRGFARSVIYLIEWIAGGDHYRNFREFNKRGGLSWYISEAGFSGHTEDQYRSNSFRVVKLSAGD